MGTPILLVVDEDRAVLEALSGDLGRRFGIDTRSSPSRPRPGALAVFHRLAEASQQVALVFAGQQMTEMAGVEFLVAAHGLHPAAKRVLRLERGDDTAANPAVRAMTLGQIDYHLFTPWLPAERCRTGSIPTTPRPAASCSGRPARTAAGCGGGLPHRAGAGRPSHAELAELLGGSVRPEPTTYDLAVVGAGPAGTSRSPAGRRHGRRPGASSCSWRPACPGCRRR